MNFQDLGRFDYEGGTGIGRFAAESLVTFMNGRREDVLTQAQSQVDARQRIDSQIERKNGDQ